MDMSKDTTADNRVDKRQSWMTLVLPGLLSVILGAVLTGVGWAAVEYLASYKKFVKSEIEIEDLSKKIEQEKASREKAQKNIASLDTELNKTKKSLGEAREALDQLRHEKSGFDEAIEECSEQKRRLGELEEKMSRLKAENKSVNRDLVATRKTVDQLRAWVNDRKANLQVCANRPGNRVDWDWAGVRPVGERYMVKPPSTISFSSGLGWIQIVSIGRDGGGTFAMVRSSVMVNPEELYCIRTRDIFKIVPEKYMGITSIDDSVTFRDSVYH